LIVCLLAQALVTSETLRADMVESNVSIALKFHYNPAGSVPGPKFLTLTPKTAMLRNADFIRALNQANGSNLGFPFDLKSRIIRRDTFDNAGNRTSTRYFLRDKQGKQAEITTTISVDIIDQVTRFKLSLANQTGTINLIATDTFLFIDGPTEQDSECSANGAGISRYNFRRVRAKLTDRLVDLLAYSARVAGRSSFTLPVKRPAEGQPTFTGPFTGIVEGSVKLTGAKILPPLM
jgi:hypothetical protein